MADYTPIAVPGAAFTLSASATIVGGQVVAVTGSGTVGPAGASSGAVVGVAAFDAASGSDVTVYTGFIVHESVASGTVTAGDQVVSAAAGQVATLAVAAGATAADINNARAVVGVALTTATTGNKVRWMSRY